MESNMKGTTYTWPTEFNAWIILELVDIIVASKDFLISILKRNSLNCPLPKFSLKSRNSFIFLFSAIWNQFGIYSALPKR